MRKLLQASIWGSHTIPPDEWKYRNLKRITFPLIDVAFILAGFAAINYGLLPLNNFFDHSLIVTMSLTLSFGGFICFIGIAFPKLWVIEIIGKSILTGLMVGYVTTVFFVTVLTNENHLFDMLIAIIAIMPVLWRVSLLGAEWQARRLRENKFGG